MNKTSAWKCEHSVKAKKKMLIAVLAIFTTSLCIAQDKPSGLRIVTTQSQTPVSGSYGVVSASRTTGVAPLVVHFSTDFTGDPDQGRGFHTYDYTWDFGDPSSGVWGTDGKSKNMAKGGIAAHVFETPGNYNVSLTIRNQEGIVAVKYFVIYVDDPDEFYAGNKTVYVNPEGDKLFPGAPERAIKIDTNNLSEVTQYVTVGRRILFKRGCTWTTPGLSGWPANNRPVTIGAYGSGERPIIVINSGVFLSLNDKRDWRIMDLDFKDPSRKNGTFGGVSNMQRILLLRIKTRGFDDGIGWGHWNDSALITIDQMAIVDCDLAEAQVNVVYIGSERLALLGNRIQNANESHVVRVWQAYRSVISNNIISGSSLQTTDGRHALKLHGPGPDEVFTAVPDTSYLEKRTDYCIVSDNIFGSSGPWPVTIGPADSGHGAIVSNIVFERNRIIAEFGSQSTTPVQLSLLVSGQVFTIRNNIIDGTNASTGYTAISVSPRGIEPAPRVIYIYNNTIFRADNGSGNGRIGILVDSSAGDVYVINNLVSFPNSTIPVKMLDAPIGITKIAGNLLDETSSFVNDAAVDPLLRNFRLKSGASGIDRGVSVQVFEDFDNKNRPAGDFDVGAFEQ